MKILKHILNINVNDHIWTGFSYFGDFNSLLKSKQLVAYLVGIDPSVNESDKFKNDILALKTLDLSNLIIMFIFL